MKKIKGKADGRMVNFLTEREAFDWEHYTADKDDVENFKHSVIRHIVSSLGKDYVRTSKFNYYLAFCLAVRDKLIDRWTKTQQSFYENESKRVYYLSLEYLPGKSLMSNLISLGLKETAEQAAADLGMDMAELEEMEWDAGLGNGGLGRLASCYIDSMAALKAPAFGYGIRYDYGIFHQEIQNGAQVEKSDNWMRTGNPWEYARALNLYEVNFGGEVHEYTDEYGRLRHEWTPANKVKAMACDLMVPGYMNDHVISTRLWASKSDLDFNLEFFNTGDYIGAVEEKVRDENISKVLYPSDEIEAGRELRLKQQYFFVSASLQDILRRFRKKNPSFDTLPDKVAVQLNETHPAVAIPELMRILVDEEFLHWDKAWDICVRTFAYTNHTILPEALETWPVEMFERLLPRHLQIIYEINRRFLEEVEARRPGDGELKSILSLIDEGPPRRVRMAHLAFIGAHSVNGVSRLHTDILKERVFKNLHNFYPDRLNNKTNGVTPRRWLLQANPEAAELISSKIGGEWVTDLNRLRELEPFAKDAEFRKQWREIKLSNKLKLAAYIKRKLHMEVNVDSIFDVQVKRIHEYKRQLLNVLHVITLYNRIKRTGTKNKTPRTVIFGGKAAPSYDTAKLIIRLIHGVAEKVNNDPDVRDVLRVLFLPNYCVSQAERIIPGTDLSEQISTAGMEASGTGNMKFSLNGGLIIGTLDGANIEMMEEVGENNIFIFGNSAEDLAELRSNGYDPRRFYHSNLELRRALDQIRDGEFAGKGEPQLFRSIYDSLIIGGDRFFVLTDYESYLRTQHEVEDLYTNNPEEWTKRSILNTARMGKFSSDRSVQEYMKDIWGL